MSDSETKIIPLATKTAGEYAAADLPELRQVVPGLIAEGATILAGSPKTGKSWLALGTAIAVASGGVVLGNIPVERRQVLYLALEDGPRRLRKRLRKLIDGTGRNYPEDLHIAERCSRMDKGGTEAIRLWLEGHERAGMIVIDTFGKVRRPPGQNVYGADYEAVGEMQRLGLDAGVAVVLLTHTRKRGANSADSDDPLEEVTGSKGITGAADVVIVLKRQRGATTGKLHVTGRDVEEQTMTLAWNAAHGLWTQTAEDEGTDADLPDEQRTVREAIRQKGGPLTIGEAREALDLPDDEKGYDTAAQLLSRMHRAGQLPKEGRGRYTLPELVNSSTRQLDGYEGRFPDELTN